MVKNKPSMPNVGSGSQSQATPFRLDDGASLAPLLDNTSLEDASNVSNQGVVAKRSRTDAAMKSTGRSESSYTSETDVEKRGFVDVQVGGTMEAPALPPRPVTTPIGPSIVVVSQTEHVDVAAVQKKILEFWGRKKRLAKLHKKVKDTKVAKMDLPIMPIKGQGKKRLAETRKESKYCALNGGVPLDDYRRNALAAKEKAMLGYGTSNSIWAKKHNPILYLPETECNAKENELISQMYEIELLNDGACQLQMSDPSDMSDSDNDEAVRFPQATDEAASAYTKPFCEFLTENPTVFHAVDAGKQVLIERGWTELSERDDWKIKPSGRYFVTRNGSSLIAFVVGEHYKPGNGAAIVAGHVDAITAKLKPVSEVANKAGYLQLGVAPYAGGLNQTWWDRDLGVGGRVLVKEGDKIVQKLVKLDWPIARVPTLAPHFGAAAAGPFNKETQMVPIIGLEGGDSDQLAKFGEPGSFVRKQPPTLVKNIGNAIGLTKSTYGDIINWELELFDLQPATVGGLNKEFIFGGRIDDKLCSWAAMQALLASQLYDTRFSSVIKVVGWFDNEEIGSQLRQGARSNFLPQIIERAVGSLTDHPTSDLIGRTYANSFLVSSDVTHAVNPNFLGEYLENHAPRLNHGLAIAADPNGHMTTDAVSTSILKSCTDRIGANLQVFQIRNDSRSGGTIGPMLSSMTGMRAIDAGMPQLSMHSIRATTGSLDPGLGVISFIGFLNGFERVDAEFRT